MTLKGHELRAEVRVPITHKGKLSVQSNWLPCLIQDMSTQGFLLVCNREFQVGEILELKCELAPKRVLECKLEVRHYDDGFVGAKIVEATPHGLKLCRAFIEEHVSLHGAR